jgi:hypothetical protein
MWKLKTRWLDRFSGMFYLKLFHYFLQRWTGNSEGVCGQENMNIHYPKEIWTRDPFKSWTTWIISL